MNLRIVGQEAPISEALKERIERRLYFALGRFSGAVASVEVTLRDEPGPDGARNRACGISVKTRGGGEVSVQGRGNDTPSLIDRTAERIGRAVGRALQVRRRRGTSPG